MKPNRAAAATRGTSTDGKRERTHELGRGGAVPDRLPELAAARDQGGRARCDERACGQAGGGAKLATGEFLHLAQVRQRGGRRELVDEGVAQRCGRARQDAGEEVASADLVVMVSHAGTSAEAASVIGDACAARKVMTMALVIGSEQRSDEELSKTLAALRPYASMLVIASGDEYIEEMLAALRA